MKVLYVFKCDNCASEAEVWEQLGEAKDSMPCIEDSCDGTMRRLFTRGGFILRGSGYYKTDY